MRRGGHPVGEHQRGFGVGPPRHGVELLDRGAAQVSTALKDEPLALEAALTSLADMYGQLALPNKSQELFLKRWKIGDLTRTQ